MTIEEASAGPVPDAMPHVSLAVLPPPGGAKKWRPNFDRKAPRVWDPERAKSIPSYPKSAEAYEAMRERNRLKMAETRAAGKLRRTDTPNGWTGRQKDLAAIRQRAAEEGRALLDAARDADLLGDDEDPRVVEALTYLAQSVRNPVLHSNERLLAARSILEFLLLRPVRRQFVTTTAESVLTALATAAGLSPLTPQPAPASTTGEPAHADH